jgi:WhiB family transcriptional regulator, redox-sensing transcriptional regulator
MVWQYVCIGNPYVHIVDVPARTHHDAGGAEVHVMLAKPHTLTTAPCLDDADRWLDGGDDPELKALCRACPRRWLCAEEALDTPNAQGMWSGVHIPECGRGRAFALRQLRSLVAHGKQGIQG